MRRKIVAGNWKMNMNLTEAKELAESIVTLSSKTEVELILGPPAVALLVVEAIVSDLKYITISGQNMHQADKGAFTGELSADMLKSVGAKYVILGHSERRQYFGETDDIVLEKINKALEYELRPIYCCGEELDQRKSGKHEQTVYNQLSQSVLKLTPDQTRDLIVAYEPVWAIGTGETASPEQAQHMHAFIRKSLRDTFGDDIADRTPILYGGSVKPSNASELFAKADVDGGLVGGASLKAADFVDISKGFTTP